MPASRRKSTPPGLGRFAKRVLWAAFLLMFLYQSWIFIHVLWWKWNDPHSTSFMSIRLEEMRAQNAAARLKHEWVDYAEISPHLKRAVIAAEDAKFMQHSGFDWYGIENAMKKNIKRGRLAAGGSTISQQLAKNLFLSPSKNIFRKMQEALITVMIEATWGKRRILEVYLNVVEWGDGVFGAQAAARRYHQTRAANLSAAQAAQMAVILPNPRKFEDRLPPYAIRYSATVLRRMPSTRIP